MRITVVLTPDFRDDPSTLGDAYWLCESPTNRRLAEKLRAEGGYDPNSTVFQGSAPYDADHLVGLLGVIDTHHPGWLAVEFVGASLTADVEAALESEGNCRGTGRGFVLERSANSAI